eukprot:748964-Hanusia_phi.AAC.2
MPRDHPPGSVSWVPTLPHQNYTTPQLQLSLPVNTLPFLSENHPTQPRTSNSAPKSTHPTPDHPHGPQCPGTGMAVTRQRELEKEVASAVYGQ